MSRLGAWKQDSRFKIATVVPARELVNGIGSATPPLMIPLNVHNIIDYVAGAVLIACPYVFGFSQIPEAASVFLVLGFGLIAYSLLTRYRYSAVKLIPVPVHMFLDAVAGVFLMLAPSLFAYRELLTTGQFVLHFVLGLGVLALVALTNTDTRDVLKGLTVEEEERTRFPRRAA